MKVMEFAAVELALAHNRSEVLVLESVFYELGCSPLEPVTRDSLSTVCFTNESIY
jgi:hypothetical protein